MKYMPWWWRDVGKLNEFVAWTSRVSLVVTSMGGGLHEDVSGGRIDEGNRYIRPSAVDANDPTRLETVRVGVLDVGDVPPYLLHAGKRRRDSGEECERGPLHVVRRSLCAPANG